MKNQLLNRGEVRETLSHCILARTQHVALKVITASEQKAKE